ncbi:MAG: hypothetical protein HKN68_02855 [Saprospiraceae bacterium]|nr:hypothetical protein [Saprospiraceae bacterium]
MKKRKLAAIMFTDIEGYTAIMQRSEEEGMGLRDRHREIFNRSSDKFNGQILQYYGDGTLSIFDSVVDAVNCGIEMQIAFQKGPVVPVRVGIHLGDIIFSEEEIIGDGVNVASRIESLAVSGSVLISDRVYNEIRNTDHIDAQFLKKFKLKNVAEPLGVYAISNPGIVVPNADEITGKLQAQNSFKKIVKKYYLPALVLLLLIAFAGFWGGSKWSEYLENQPDIKVVVLPFEQSVSLDENESQLGDVTQELIEELSKIDRAMVLSRATSTVLTAGFSSSQSLISDQINDVDYFIKGNAELDDDQMKIDVSVSEQKDGPLIWEKSYESTLSKARNLWTEIAAEIGKEIGLKRSVEKMAKRANIQPINPESYKLYLQAKSQFNQMDPEAFQRGIQLMEEALDKDPTDAHAYAHLAEGYVAIGHFFGGSPDVFPKALSAARRSIQLDSTVAMAWAALSHYHTYFGMDWELAEYAFEKANELNPNMAYNHYHRAWYLVLFGRMNEAIEEHKIAQQLEPFDPFHTAWLGEIYRLVGMYDEALAEVEKADQMVKNNQVGQLVKGRVLLDLGKTDEAIKTFKEAKSKYNNYAQALLKAGRIDEVRTLMAELESMPMNHWWARCLAILYCQMEEKDKCFEWLNYPERHAWFPWMRVMWLPESIKKDPRFLGLMDEMNLPHPAPFKFDPNELSI